VFLAWLAPCRYALRVKRYAWRFGKRHYRWGTPGPQTLFSLKFVEQKKGTQITQIKQIKGINRILLWVVQDS